MLSNVIQDQDFGGFNRRYKSKTDLRRFVKPAFSVIRIGGLRSSSREFIRRALKPN